MIGEMLLYEGDEQEGPAGEYGLEGLNKLQKSGGGTVGQQLRVEQVDHEGGRRYRPYCPGPLNALMQDLNMMVRWTRW